MLDTVPASPYSVSRDRRPSFPTDADHPPLPRRREVEHAPAASPRLAPQPRIRIHRDWLAHELEQREVADVVRIECAFTEADAELACNGARPVHLPFVDAKRLVQPAREHAVLHFLFDGGPSDRTQRPGDRRDEEIHPTPTEDHRCVRTAVIAHELGRLTVDRSRPALDEPLFALPSELLGASSGEGCAGDAAEHRASREPSQALAAG